VVRKRNDSQGERPVDGEAKKNLLLLESIIVSLTTAQGKKKYSHPSPAHAVKRRDRKK